MGLWHTNRTPNHSQKTRPYNNQQKKKRICKSVDFAVSDDHKIKLEESEKKDKHLDLACQGVKKQWNVKVTIIPIGIGVFGTITIIKGIGGLGSWRTSGDHRDNSIIENGQNTEKSPGNLRRLAVTQTTVKDHQLMLMGKTLMGK